MSTNDVPGHRPQNRDVLAMGCWAEHDDGSLIFVQSTEAGRVVYSVFDMSKAPIVEYRDAMPVAVFQKQFSWEAETAPPRRKGKDQSAEKLRWTWHDKTPFPWDRVIKAGATDGARFASAADMLTAAEKVAASLKLRGERVLSDNLKHMATRTESRALRVIGGIQHALDKLSNKIRGDENHDG